MTCIHSSITDGEVLYIVGCGQDVQILNGAFLRVVGIIREITLVVRGQVVVGPQGSWPDRKRDVIAAGRLEFE